MIAHYSIHHFDLAADDAFAGYRSGAQYCVFWYRSIPLGHVYFSDTEQLSQDDLCSACLAAISAALSYYAGQSGNNQFQLPNVPDVHSIRTLCASILERLQAGEVSGECDVSVVICTRDRAVSLKACLQCLLNQRCKPAEIIVVDNASVTQETKKIVSQFSGVRYIREDKPGLDVARNTGVRHACCSTIAFTDDDTLPDAYWVYRIAETFRQPAVAAMTGLVLTASLQTEAEVIFEKFWPFNRGYCGKIYDHNFFAATRDTGTPVWEIGAGANMAFRKSIFESVGYFDERLDAGAAGCSGDSELWYRILAHGYTIHYNPMAVVHHRHRASIRELRQQIYSYMRGFTSAILFQYERFGHRGNLQHLFRELPRYYLRLIRKGFPFYNFQYQTLFDEIRGVVAGLIYYWKHRHTDPKIFKSHEA